MTRMHLTKSLRILVPVLGAALLAACATTSDTDDDTSTGRDSATGSSGGTQ